MNTITSRTTLFTALALSFCLTHAAGPTEAANATGSIDHNPLAQAVMHQINRYVVFPLGGEQDSMYGVVDVAFKVNAEGGLVILNASSANEELCDYVIGKLTRVHVRPNPSGVWNTSHIRFTFLRET